MKQNTHSPSYILLGSRVGLGVLLGVDEGRVVKVGSAVCVGAMPLGGFGVGRHAARIAVITAA